MNPTIIEQRLKDPETNEKFLIYYDEIPEELQDRYSLFKFSLEPSYKTDISNQVSVQLSPHWETNMSAVVYWYGEDISPMVRFSFSSAMPVSGDIKVEHLGYDRSKKAEYLRLVKNLFDFYTDKNIDEYWKDWINFEKWIPENKINDCLGNDGDMYPVYEPFSTNQLRRVFFNYPEFFDSNTNNSNIIEDCKQHKICSHPRSDFCINGTYNCKVSGKIVLKHKLTYHDFSIFDWTDYDKYYQHYLTLTLDQQQEFFRDYCKLTCDWDEINVVKNKWFGN